MVSWIHVFYQIPLSFKCAAYSALLIVRLMTTLMKLEVREQL